VRQCSETNRRAVGARQHKKKKLHLQTRPKTPFEMKLVSPSSLVTVKAPAYASRGRQRLRITDLQKKKRTTFNKRKKKNNERRPYRDLQL
jgi:hypothetical protein